MCFYWAVLGHLSLQMFPLEEELILVSLLRVEKDLLHAAGKEGRGNTSNTLILFEQRACKGLVWEAYTRPCRKGSVLGAPCAPDHAWERVNS